MAYGRNGGNRSAPPQEEKKNLPVFTRRIWTPSGTIEVAVFEKQVGERKQHTNYFVTLNRSYPDPQNDGKYVDTTVLNPQDLLIAADLYKIAWEFILDQVNRE
jgi:hypothetical protein